ncbi:putative RNA pseudouridine synthase [Anaerolineae bacterium]|nr:putative RNA pseudouridine synthase [Anaerolineae bacterium]
MAVATPAGAVHTFQLAQRGERLDKALVEFLPDLSRAQIQRLIEGGQVLINGQLPAKAGVRLEGGETAVVAVPAPVPSTLIAEAIPLQVVYEDADMLVLDKPAGLVVHPAAGHASGTLVNALLAHVKDFGGVGGSLRPGIVHRLDKDTSGLIVVAKHDAAQRALQAQFKLRKVEKQYVALVVGRPPTPSGRVEAPIGRDPRQRQRMAVVTNSELRSRMAVSEYRTREALRGYTLVDVKPETGRTHQVRVHMAFLGCPLAGDLLYGVSGGRYKLARHFLHAAVLTLKLPSGKTQTFVAPLPAELEACLAALRG